ncbi:hypothetical protein ASG52_04565 [Methylobacterium sp. Leaf456]|uniref:hypothetical protein n=1 Tax=Methylobacterium sp. Leaf456 TaxID=1736382 RepID=UPI0006FEA272|nr:hypothetical protein [Methylobacterium sp. Leaf456]KQT53402.1 hypothetical protein ASG52_04565 [Methylobacterium sp. Leaf456]
MVTPPTRDGQHRRCPNGAARPRNGEASTEMRNRLALNRFTYRGGYDGYEGRMILRPELAKPSGSKG